MNYKEIFVASKEASRKLAVLTDARRSEMLRKLSSLLLERTSQLLEANAADLAKMDPSSPLCDRLRLTSERIADIASGLLDVASLPTPVGETVESRTLYNGIELRKVRVPFGVIGVIYEARPNVTFDVFALCLKSGNAAVLKGGREAEQSNIAAATLIHEALCECGLPEQACVLLPATHEAAAEMLSAVGLIDVCIPRGGRRLIDFVRANAKVPVIETGAGVVHVFVHEKADIAIAAKVVDNAKTRRVSVCNALDTLLIDRAAIDALNEIVMPLVAKGVELHADKEAFAILRGCCPPELLREAEEADKDREWMDMKIGIFVVDGLQGAIEHISAHGSGHSESIVTEDEDAAARFTEEVDASTVYVNLPTSFTDGGQFGLGAEIGISTQKLGPRGPMGLREITTTKYILTGRGQIRK